MLKLPPLPRQRRHGSPRHGPRGEFDGGRERRGEERPPRCESPATAADLGDFGSRDWIRAVLLDFKSHFAAFKTRDRSQSREDLLENSEMADWSETNKAVLSDPANKESLAALIEFLAAQSGRTDQPPPDVALAAKGLAIFQTGKLAKDKLSASCVDCHPIKLPDGKTLGKEGGLRF